MTEHLKVSTANGVMEITFARPEKKNAINNEMYRAATDALEQASADASVRVVLLNSIGDSFTAGNDLSVFAAVASGGEEPGGNRFIRTLAKFDKPLIGAVRGVAVGIGVTMLLHCDLVYVAADARLSTPFVNLALVPEAASSLLMPSRIGHARAFALFALGEPVTGETATAWGIANAALPAADVDATARKAAAELAKRPLGAVMATKKLMRSADVLLKQIEAETTVFGQRLLTAEAAEAFTAFREKRPADFSKV